MICAKWDPAHLLPPRMLGVAVDTGAADSYTPACELTDLSKLADTCGCTDCWYGWCSTGMDTSVWHVRPACSPYAPSLLVQKGRSGDECTRW